MRIKKLEISGFKSFAERARLVFGEGITGVVGPNGCGKSNIVDAIRWCMGEMSAKHLRGRAMQDVIFAGADNRGPMGMAEVTLTFDTDGDVPSTYLNYSEIAVTRRLFRDGTSEYLLNKTPVRLRDVTDLFLGTGVGTRAYSIIEQGRIGFVVNSRPEERRTLIEEVAGITKFKARKKSAERRMESTEQNLLRVNDVVTELERQLGSLRRQAKKAERFKEMRAEQRDLELHMAAMDMLRLAAVEKVHLGTLQDSQEALSATQQGLVDDESGVEASRQALLDEERRLQHEQQASAALDSELAGLQRDLAHWRRELTQAQERGEHGTQQVQQAQTRIEQAQEERAQLEAEETLLEDAAAADTGLLAEARGVVESLQEQLAALDEQLEMLRRDALRHVQGAAKQRSVAANLERQRDDLQVRLRNAAEEREGLRVREAQVQTQCETLATRRDSLRAQLHSWGEELRTWRDSLPALRSRCQDSAKALRSQHDELRGRRSRLASLEEIARRLDGYSDGVRTLLGAKGNHAVPGLLGLVTQILEVPPALEPAVEAVLGDKLQYLLVHDGATAKSAIAHLQACKGGRSGFIPAELSAAPSALPQTEPGVGPALQQIAFAPQHADIAAYLLGDVLVCDSLDAAINAQSATPGWVCVSLQGDVVDAHGVIAGGSANGAGLLANRREIRELVQRVALLQEALHSAEAAHQILEEQRQQLERNIQELGKDIHSAELEQLDVAKDCDSAVAERKRVEARLANLARDVGTWTDSMAQLDNDAAAAVSAAQAAESGHQEVEERLQDIQERRSMQASQLSHRSEELTAVKVRISAQQEKAGAARAAIQRLHHSVQELHERVAHAQGAIAASQAQVAELAANLRAGDEKYAAQNEQAQSRRDALAAARVTYERCCAELAEQERQLKEQRKGSETLHNTILASKMELQKVELERQQLTDQTLERHDIVMSHVVQMYHLRPLPDGASKKRAQEIERSIRNLGPINLTAIDECAEVEQRFTFLSQQRDDLQGALDALRRAIQRINRASRERFREAFDAVNEMFQKVYPRLFRGGVARLELTESEDLLEAGVDIIAMPPGKKLQNVGLLSGGEKALTATALVFAIFLIKPSPFCILDEVDAPLDEANVGRFNDMLQEIAKVSQFIVITHNKATMLHADRLYGITMEEPGMSKVVSVDLQKRKEQAA